MAIGYSAGKVFQGESAVAIGTFSGFTQQGIDSIAVGNRAGQKNQGEKRDKYSCKLMLLLFFYS